MPKIVNTDLYLHAKLQTDIYTRNRIQQQKYYKSKYLNPPVKNPIFAVLFHQQSLILMWQKYWLLNVHIFFLVEKVHSHSKEIKASSGRCSRSRGAWGGWRCRWRSDWSCGHPDALGWLHHNLWCSWGSSGWYGVPGTRWVKKEMQRLGRTVQERHIWWRCDSLHSW